MDLTLGEPWGITRKFNAKVARVAMKNYPNERFFNTAGTVSFQIWNWWPFKKVFAASKLSAYRSTFLNRFVNIPLPDLLKAKKINFTVTEFNNIW